MVASKKKKIIHMLTILTKNMYITRLHNLPTHVLYKDEKNKH